MNRALSPEWKRLDEAEFSRWNNALIFTPPAALR
jgi:hypothetical protein